MTWRHCPGALARLCLLAGTSWSECALVCSRSLPNGLLGRFQSMDGKYLLAADMLSKRKGGLLGSEKARMLSARKAHKNVLKLYRKMTRGAYDDAGGGLSSEGSSNRQNGSSFDDEDWDPEDD